MTDSQAGPGEEEAESSEPDPLAEAFERTVAEGQRRLERSWSSLFATGIVGGLDVATGVLALLVVTEATGKEMLGALAFGIGFVALVLGQSELFTENFLVPVTARIIGRSQRLLAVSRLWAVTLVTNLIGGWVAMALVMAGFPKLHATAVMIGRRYVEQGTGWEAFAQALIGGMVITLMTWMERGTDSMPAKLIAVWAMAFLLAAGPLNHVIIVSLEMSAALVAGAPFGYGAAIGAAAWAALGNIVGGLGLVTVLRLVQLGREIVDAERPSDDADADTDA